MKPISINAQEKLIYLPIVNIFTIFIALYNCVCTHTPIRVWTKIYLYLLGYTIPSVVFWAIIAGLFPALSSICTVATMYISPLFMSYGLILFQKKHLNL